ncbi:unnamed protein product [Linum trigynum]|uniref:Uncharacterized protein n=1 Tax=Linum trigynum TaxID=586398 RepID=A0AAV2EKV5_9ROSI
MAALLATGLRALFLAMSCTFAAIAIYTYYNHPAYRKETYTTWLCAAITEFYIHMSPLALWVAYKESNFVRAAIWILAMIPSGSAGICGYIFIQFLKLSPQESAQDPIHHVLLRHEHKNCKSSSSSSSSSSMVASRTAFISLGCLMIAALVSAVYIAGSPFRMEVLLAPWVITTLIDSAFVTVTLSVWVFYKETSWLSASLWVILLICLGSLAVCAYMTKQLFLLSSHDPVYQVLLRDDNCATDAKVPLLSSSVDQFDRSSGQGN